MRFYKIVTLILLVVVIVSCDDLLTENPGSSISSDQFYRTSEDAVAAVNAVYEPLPEEFHNYILTIMTTDDGYAASGAGAALVQQMWRYNWSPNNGRVFGGYWESQYDVINRANMAIENIPTIEMDENLKSRLLGEARFVRAYTYFKLVRLFGGVPVITSPTQSADEVNVERATVEEVYTQIIEDLTFAEDNLLDQASTQKGRASVTAATGMLARVYLTRENWEQAAQKAEEIIDAGNNALMSDYQDLFHPDTEDNDEVIFAHQFVAQGGFGYPSKRYLPRGVIPDWRGLGAFAPTWNLYNSYEADDLRRDISLVTSWETEGGDILNFDPWWRKFWDMTIDNTDDAGIDVPIIRYADILLMYAEAINESENGPTLEAYEAVNMVRRRAYGEDINSPSSFDLPPGLNQQDFREAVWQERRWELAGEYHRWYDLKRTGRLQAVVSDWLQNGEETEGGAATGTFEEKNLLYPIPQSEIDANPNLEQNPGW